MLNEQEVKAAYKQAVKECHPDRHISSPQIVQLQAVERFKVGSTSVQLSPVRLPCRTLLSANTCMQRVKEAYEALGTGT